MTGKRFIRQSAIWLSRNSFWIAALWVIAWAGSFAASVAYGDTESSLYITSRACTSGESWHVGSTAVPDGYRSEFNDFLGDSNNPAKALRGFSEAIALRRFAKTETQKAFAEYWISRALFGLKLPHLAEIGFQSIALRDPNPSIVPIHAAALDCLLRIHLQHPSIQISENVLAHLSTDLGSAIPEKELRSIRPAIWDFAVAGLQIVIASDRNTPEQLQAKSLALLSDLKGAGAYEDLARGIWAARQMQHQETIRYMSRFFNDSIPDSLNRYEDTAHLLSARAHFAIHQFDAAANEMKLVRRSSNLLAESLQELAWADLKNYRYPEAIGTAMNLDGGGLRHTYTPEAPMVSAMAMNELCQYPDAVKEIAVFRRDYKTSYSWLSSWAGTQADHPQAVAHLYEQAVQFIRRKSTIPDRVAGEWVRTPLFIASQDEVNALFDEKDALSKIAVSASREQRGMATQILQDARDLAPKYQIARMKLKAGEQLPPSILTALAHLKQEVIHWRRFRKAAPVWLAIAHRFRGTIVPRQNQLVVRINEQIKEQNVRMLTQLDEIAENIQLIEVEIYNGASQDIIWQNAHPDYKKIAEQMKEENQAVERSKTWDWGREPASSDDSQEIWEDELGSFKANLFDNCSSKDKYIAIRMHRHRYR